MAWRIGIDIGGTFTDVAAADSRTGEMHLHKSSSTPAELAAGAAAALEALGGSVPLGQVSFLAHGTTAGTNALIEGRGARTGLITTMGFRDLLEIGRQQRPSLYDLRARKPHPLVPRWLRREVGERLRSDGSVIRPLEVAAVRREVAALREEGVEALAICLLHSYANASHERAVRDLAQRLLPGVYVTASCDLAPRFREYERVMTTVVNAYLGPLMNRYLDELRDRLGQAGLQRTLYIMQSNGGIAPVAETRGRPAGTVLSGPAAGTAAAADLCCQLGIERAIAIDMGGTSTDLCLVEGGLPATAKGREVGGYAVELPGVDVRCIGAGGGSMLWVDRDGLPRVGPRSAGSDPGPACYGGGGEEPTLTDAFLVLGRIASEGFLDGELSLDQAAARGAVARRFSDPIGIDVEGAALGAVELAVANVRRAIERMTVAEGRDPREFSLIAAGGAGPLIACELASELSVREVIVPSWPGNFSACGLLASDLRRDWVQTRLIAAGPETLPELARGFEPMEREAKEWLADKIAPGGQGSVLRRVAARYIGQDYELEIGVPSGQLRAGELSAVLAEFHRAHEEHYGYSLPEHPVEFVDLMVAALGQVPRPRRGARSSTRHGGTARARSRRVVMREGAEKTDCPVYDRAELEAHAVVEGPAIVEQYDSTSYIPAGRRARMDDLGNLRITQGVGG
jgi:N-methylhydantoinase A